LRRLRARRRFAGRHRRPRRSWSGSRSRRRRGTGSRRGRRSSFRRLRLRRSHGQHAAQPEQRRAAQKKQTPLTTRHTRPRFVFMRKRPLSPLRSAVGASDAPTRMRSSDGRRAGRKECRGRGDPAKFHRRIRAPPPESKRQGDGRRFGQSNSADQTYECTDRTIMICAIRAVVVCGSRRGAICRLDYCRGLRTNAMKVHMSERDHELERERKQRDVRAQPQTRSQPAHGP
jgi:hypothetical protein